MSLTSQRYWYVRYRTDSVEKLSHDSRHANTSDHRHHPLGIVASGTCHLDHARRVCLRRASSRPDPRGRLAGHALRQAQVTKGDLYVATSWSAVGYHNSY